MKKAKVILTIIVLFAFVGGALAFKAKKNKFTNTIFLVYTNSYLYNGVIYVLPQSYCIRPTVSFVTVSGGVVSTGYYTTTPPYGGHAPATRPGITLTLTYYLCNGLPFGETQVTTIN